MHATILKNKAQTTFQWSLECKLTLSSSFKNTKNKEYDKLIIHNNDFQLTDGSNQKLSFYCQMNTMLYSKQQISVIQRQNMYIHLNFEMAIAPVMLVIL